MVKQAARWYGAKDVRIERGGCRESNLIRSKIAVKLQESVVLTCMNTWMDQFLFRQKQSMSTGQKESACNLGT